MRRISFGIAAIALVLEGCTNSLHPVVLPVAASQSKGKVEVCSDPATTTSSPPKQRLLWMVCKLHARAIANLDQAQRWENRSEWRNLPLIGAATAVAGLLLFGKRDANNALKPGVQDAVTGIGFSAAAIVAFANYLSPQKARDVLRQGARGHFCIATQGELILSIWDSLDQTTARDLLTADLGELTAKLSITPNSFSSPDTARTVQAQAIRALALYDLQIRERDTSALAIGETTWNFGIDLLTRTDREDQNVEALVKSISEQARSTAKFEVAGANATDPAAPAAAKGLLMGVARAANRTPDELSSDVAEKTTALMANLPNVEALVLGFDKCAATALAGGTAKAERIQRVTVQ